MITKIETAKRALPFALILILGACSVDTNTANNAAALNDAQADAALNEALNSADQGNGETRPEFMGTLTPPAPGEVGGLPDDRAPLNETAARVPTSVEASGATIELWGLALSQGRYEEAARFWAPKTGMNEARVAQAYRPYSEIHALVGRPETGGTQTALVPVQLYGRMREDGRPFNLVGKLTLSRNPAGQNGEPGQSPWLIAASELAPRGTVRITAADGSAKAGTAKTGSGVIPLAFRGSWSTSSTSCAAQGDDMRLAVKADSLVFYESVGNVTEVRTLSPNRLRVTANYSGEGETWSDSAPFTLSGGGDVLTIGAVKRVRCSA